MMTQRLMVLFAVGPDAMAGVEDTGNALISADALAAMH